jgi:AcrR family transcriptional regulator
VSTVVDGRTYGGRTLDERRQIRRDRFIEAVIEVVGDRGFANLRVRGLCRHAGLADRYFYEQFDSLEDALGAAYATIMDDVLAATVASVRPAGDLSVAGQTRAAVAAFVDAVTGDRRRARIQLLEVVGVSDRVEAERRAAMGRFSALITDLVRTRPTLLDEAVDLELTAVSLVGAVDELLVAWIHGEIDPELDRLVATLTALFLRALPR